MAHSEFRSKYMQIDRFCPRCITSSCSYARFILHKFGEDFALTEDIASLNLKFSCKRDTLVVNLVAFGCQWLFSH